MNLTILDGILHGPIKPVFVRKIEPKTLAGYIIEAKRIKPTSLKHLAQQQAALLQPFGKITFRIDEYADTPIGQLPFETELPAQQTILDQYYHLLISNAAIHIYNGILQDAEGWNHAIDQEYQVTKALRNLKVLAQQANDEQKEINQLSDEKETSSLYPLLTLKLQAINLYFSVQETFKQFLSTSISLEDFYTLELLESSNDVIPLIPVTIPVKAGVQSRERSAVLKFDFNGDKQKLASVIFQLCQEINLLNSSLCSQKDLNEILTSKNIVPGKIKIYLDCETTQFRHVIDRFNPFFKSLSLVNIEKTNSFFTKDGGKLKAGNLRSSKVPDCKQKKEIDQIINQLQ
jgi:hypothetical protein